MPTDNSNNSGNLMWRDENGNWHPLGKLQNIEPTSESDDAPILHATTLSDSEEVVIHADMCTIPEEIEAMFWAQAEGLDIVER